IVVDPEPIPHHPRRRRLGEDLFYCLEHIWLFAPYNKPARKYVHMVDSRLRRAGISAEWAISPRGAQPQLRLIRQLPARRIDVLSAAAPEPRIDAVLLEMLHELLNGLFARFGETGLGDRVIFDDIDEIGGNLPEDLY